LNGSIPVSRLGDLQFQLAYDIAQQASQVGVVLDHQHQFALVIVLNRHVFLSIVWMQRTPYPDQCDKPTLMPSVDPLIVKTFCTRLSSSRGRKSP
jgi:hypothetical protein